MGLRITPTRRLLLQAAADGRVVCVPAIGLSLRRHGGVALLVDEAGVQVRGVTGPTVLLRRHGLLALSREAHPSYPDGCLLRLTPAGVDALA